MTRILAIDFGMKRCGLAATDPLRIAAHALCTVDRANLKEFILSYVRDEKVEYIVMGDGRHADGNDSHVTEKILEFREGILKIHPELPIILVEESFTSFDAKQIIFQSGAKKKKRREKGLIDKISAVLILQRHLGHV